MIVRIARAMGGGDAGGEAQIVDRRQMKNRRADLRKRHHASVKRSLQKTH